MFLTPHHFQQSDRYQQAQLRQSVKALQPFGWGAWELQIDVEALASGNLILSRCGAVLPDGLLIGVPETDQPPLSRPIEPAFDSKRERLGVYLAAPTEQPGGINCSADGVGDGRPTRYRNFEVSLQDQTSGGNQRQVETAVKNLRILFDGEQLDGNITLRIGELTRTATGAYALAESYSPPCLQIRASDYLMRVLRRMVEGLSSKAAELAIQRRQRASGLSEFTVSESANFWYLHTLNSALPGLLHCYNNPTVHPEQLYLQMSHLAGQLYTFADAGQPKDLPVYQHDDLTTTFSLLEQKVRTLLETVIPSKCVPIPLERRPDSGYNGRIPDDRLLANAEFYLALSSSSSDEKVMLEVPKKAKISSLDRVDRLIAQALRGVGLKYLAAPPSEIPVRPGKSYFQLEKSGEHWDAVRSSRTLAIYIPPEFTDLTLECMAVKS